MTEIEKNAVENVRKATAGKPAGALCGVVAGEVVTVADLVPEKDRDQLVKDLRAGASGARPLAVVYQIQWQLTHLLGKVPPVKP